MQTDVYPLMSYPYDQIHNAWNLVFYIFVHYFTLYRHINLHYVEQLKIVAKSYGKNKGKKKSKKAKKNVVENMEELLNMKEIFIQSSQDLYHLADFAQQYNWDELDDTSNADVIFEYDQARVASYQSVD